MFPMPRVLYSMASDGLVFKPFAYILPKFKTPAISAVATGLLAAFLVLLFDLQQLINMMSIGTLLAYCLVSACTLALRYTPESPYMIKKPGVNPATVNATEGEKDVEMKTTVPSETPVDEKKSPDDEKDVDEGDMPYKNKFVRKVLTVLIGNSSETIFRRMFRPKSKKPTRAISRLASTVAIMLFWDMFFICLILNQPTFTPVMDFFLAVFLLVLIVLVVVIFCQPQTKEIQTFKVK
jgi:amino acid transporter